MNHIPPRPTATREMILECCKPIAEKLEADAETLAQYYSRHMEPPFAIGDSIKQGLITGISDYTPACFEVKLEGQSETTRLIIKFEDAKAA
ncbi:hypothetical protein [Pseudomonas sp. TWI929]|uniref:hypothetical protein n=1 Tax=Pseudomonas sp. TWI929 TaxID=3136795 RepID=UPI0032087CC8